MESVKKEEARLAWGFAAIGMLVAAIITAIAMAFYNAGSLIAIPIGGCFGYAIGAGYARWKAARSAKRGEPTI